MPLTLDLPTEFDNDLQTLINSTLKQIVQDIQIQNTQKEWMSLKEGANYAGVSYNTFMKFRIKGLKISEIDGVKRVSKTEIDNFLNNNSY
ncbi:DNA-binding protein [Lysinibacillus sp. NPDC093692]|uniref:DNA-binding protein n=1 Tax=Lysinibacillus sp. NPDC093692 TaxID=3390578 RepID=UPI003CFEE71C